MQNAECRNKNFRSAAGGNIAIFIPHKGCPCRCVFCDQRAITGQVSQPTPQDVTEIVSKAVAVSRADRTSAPTMPQIAFFGGSFTAIDREYMHSLLEAAHGFVASGSVRGIRVSTRPDCIDQDVLSLLKQYGVTAIELGAQSMDGAVLAASGRGHTAEDTVMAAGMIRERGFELGLQMMTGLPGADERSDMATARALAELKPDTVRIYPALVLKGAPLFDMYQKGDYTPQTLDDAINLCSRLLLRFNYCKIKVIKLGLHASRDVERELVAGPYHPAFRELCESKIYFDAAASALTEKPPGDYTLSIPAGAVSKMTGQRRENLCWLAQMGYNCKVREDVSLPTFHVGAHCVRPQP